MSCQSLRLKSSQSNVGASLLKKNEIPPITTFTAIDKIKTFPLCKSRFIIIFYNICPGFPYLFYRCTISFVAYLQIICVTNVLYSEFLTTIEFFFLKNKLGRRIVFSFLADFYAIRFFYTDKL